MFEKNFKIIKLRSAKLTKEVEIHGFDEDAINEHSLLIGFVENVSKNKNIFINSNGLEENSLNKSIIANSANDLNNPLRTSLKLENVLLGNVHKNIFESKYVIFYVFDASVSWHDFIITRNIRERKYFKKGLLIASISVGRGETVLISISNNFSIYVEQLIDGLKNTGYKVKKPFCLD